MKAKWRKLGVCVMILMLSLTTIAGIGHGERISALGVNYVQNPGFESGDLTNWTVDGTLATSMANTDSKHEGSYGYNYWNGTAYSFSLYQTVTGLETGTYELRAWVSGGAADGLSISLYADGFGGGKLSTAAANSGYGNWAQYKVEGIEVTGGQAEIGIEVNAAGEAWGYFDDFELVKVGEPDPVDPDDFIKGVDISTLQALEDKGIRFYEDGVETDLLDILSNHGVNYVRLRLWNNPVEADGYNDKEHLIEMAQRVKAAGLKLLVDFHYSDFWADPGKQVKPEAWKDLDFEGLKSAVNSYTAEVLAELAEAGAYPDMVQVGNEINSGMLLPDGAIGNYGQLAELLAAGIAGVRETTPDGHETKIMLHLAEGGNNAAFRYFFDKAEEYELDYDVIGMSYYPYWHGTFQELKTNMNDMAARYGKPIIVAETAYPYTLDNDDELENIATKAQTDVAGFEASVENQKLVTETVLNTVANVEGGLGLGAFYWEPAWLAGVGWKSGEGNGWENQAMFDFDGNALDSLDAFLYTPGSMGEAAPVLVYPSMGITTTKGAPVELPETISVLYNEGSIQEAPVVWDEVEAAKWNTPGKFTINGTVEGLEQRASIEITVLSYANHVVNGGFETGDLTGWTVEVTPDAGKIDFNAGNAHSGGHSFNYWYASDYAYKLTQSFTGLTNGTYTLKVWASGGAGETKFQLFAMRNEADKSPRTADIINTGYNAWKQYVIEGIKVNNGKLTIGFDVEAVAGTWGFLDDVELIMTAKTPSPTDNESSRNEGTEAPGLYVLTQENIHAGSSGKFTVKLPEGVTEVELPSTLYPLLEQGSLTLDAGSASIEIPAETIAELRGKLSGEPSSSVITIKLLPVDGQKLSRLIAANGGNANTEAKPAGAAYEFELSIRSEDGGEVSLAQFGEPIILRVKPSSLSAEGQPYTGIYYVSPDGGLTYVGGELADGVWTAEIGHFSAYALLEVVTAFNDVPAAHWAYGPITELASKQLISGLSAAAFEPGRAITRAEFTAMLAGGLKLDGVSEHRFADVGANAWYAPAVRAAYEAGIIAGRSGTVFDPDAVVSRQEMAAMLMKAYAYILGATIPAMEAEAAPFADRDKISAWALPSVDSAYGLKLLQGRSSGAFDPKASLTRAEAAAALHRLLML